MGTRPAQIGAVSDADGAIVALACGLKLLDMAQKGERLDGDVMITTHICPQAPTVPHDPVPFMGAPVSLVEMLAFLVDARMEAILSVDATKGNEVINCNGFAISPTVKEGYILRVSPDLLRLMKIVTGKPPVTFPLAIQDITPYGNELYHINSIMQPATVTTSPVVGYPAPQAWRTERGLAALGPQHFGYDLPYRPLEENPRLQMEGGAR